jgi:hypothetical protein
MARKEVWRRLESARCPGRTAWRPGHRHGPRRHRPAGRRIACAGRARECGGARPERPRTLCRSARRAPRPRSRRALGRIVVAAAGAVRRLRPARGRHGGDRAGTAGADRRRPGAPDPGRPSGATAPPTCCSSQSSCWNGRRPHAAPAITLVLHVLAPHSRWRPSGGSPTGETRSPRPAPGRQSSAVHHSRGPHRASLGRPVGRLGGSRHPPCPWRTPPPRPARARDPGLTSCATRSPWRWRSWRASPPRLPTAGGGLKRRPDHCNSTCSRICVSFRRVKAHAFPLPVLHALTNGKAWSLLYVFWPLTVRRCGTWSYQRYETGSGGRTSEIEGRQLRALEAA